MTWPNFYQLFLICFSTLSHLFLNFSSTFSQLFSTFALFSLLFLNFFSFFSQPFLILSQLFSTFFLQQFSTFSQLFKSILNFFQLFIQPMYLHLGEHPKGVIIGTCDILDTDYSADNWEPGFANNTWQLIVTLDSIRNACHVSSNLPLSALSAYTHTEWLGGWVTV